MTEHKVGTREEWLAAREELLAQEKELSGASPWVLVVLREVVEDLMPRSLRTDKHVSGRLERWLVDQ